MLGFCVCMCVHVCLEIRSHSCRLVVRVALYDGAGPELPREPMSSLWFQVSNPELPKQDGSLPIDEIYQKKTQREHILLRPEPYIGSVQRVGPFCSSHFT